MAPVAQLDAMTGAGHDTGGLQYRSMIAPCVHSGLFDLTAIAFFGQVAGFA
jgi:hypothetical protein